MSKKHVQHKVSYCCDQGLSFFTAELNEAVEHGFKAGILSERERILSIIRQQENWNGHYFNAGETTEDCGCRDCEPVLQLIALIEGKNIG